MKCVTCGNVNSNYSTTVVLHTHCTRNTPHPRAVMLHLPRNIQREHIRTLVIMLFTVPVEYNSCERDLVTNNRHRVYVEIKCQLDTTEVFIADLIACSTCFGHHHAHHQELKSIIQWLLRVVFCALVFQVAGLVWS